MKKLLHIFFLFSSIVSFFIYSKEPVVIESPVLQMVDGTKFVQINQVIYFIQFIQGIQHGFKLKVFFLFKNIFNYIPSEDEQIIKLFEFKGIKYNLKELVELEENYPDMRVELHKILEEVIRTFELVSEPYLNQVKGARTFMVQLIEQWSKQVQKPHTYLLAWNKNDTNEKEHIRHDLTTLKAFNNFLEDLKLFLNDLAHSCKNSYAQYKKQHTQPPSRNPTGQS
jgi:hypothetical protein